MQNVRDSSNSDDVWFSFKTTMQVITVTRRWLVVFNGTPALFRNHVWEWLPKMPAKFKFDLHGGKHAQKSGHKCATDLRQESNF